MTPIPITRAMREAAEKATAGDWVLGASPYSICVKPSGYEVARSDSQYGINRDGANAAHIALANPANVLALLDALEEAGKAMEDARLRLRRPDWTVQRDKVCALLASALDRIRTLSGEEE